jgi:5-methyltetrahydropteroyltriglutamate--homocysteine methyltransferase
MCYAEFGEILDAVDELDADVISLEAASSRMRIADELTAAGYPRAVGPGAYDIHAPRVPEERELTGLIDRALLAVPAERLWINPDCGLKTRSWTEAGPAPERTTAAARRVRGNLPE